MITYLIALHIDKLILNHVIGNNCTDFRNELLYSYLLKLILGSGFLKRHFQI